MKPLLLLPLDDRPVSLDLPRQLAGAAGETLPAPPAAMLGHFLAPGDPEALLDWLAREAPAARGAILALDMLAYGGLVASRTTTTPHDLAVRRLQALREIKARNPHLRLYAFNVIMRLTITGSDPETCAAGEDIFRYSVLRDEVERLGLPRATELATVEARIPHRMLEVYLGARTRNHAVNRAAIELLADGVLDDLALVQEDTAPHGLHVAEQLALLELARERADARRWRLYAGTDEASQTLLARFLLREAGVDFPVALHFRDAQIAADCPALFEDVPLAETVRRHVDAVGGVIDAGGVPLAVHTFTPPQPDLCGLSAPISPTWETALAAFPRPAMDKWLAALGTTSPIVADTAYCNGGDPHLLDALLSRGWFAGLEGYAGWNTAGNTLGTTLAMAAIRRVARARGTTAAMEAAHRAALQVRLLDDGLYQAVVRAWISTRVKESGLSPLNVGKDAPMVDAWVDDIMQALWREVRERYALPDTPFRAVLPWGRLFEVRILPAPR